MSDKITNVSSTGEWKDGSGGTQYRTGGDGKDGSQRSERLSPSGDGSHYHEIIKSSTDGRTKTIITSDKNKRGG
jgi:hypothetical protein